jgi:hypothetical protein
MAFDLARWSEMHCGAHPDIMMGTYLRRQLWPWLLLAVRSCHSLVRDYLARHMKDRPSTPTVADSDFATAMARLATPVLDCVVADGTAGRMETSRIPGQRFVVRFGSRLAYGDAGYAGIGVVRSPS